MDLVIHRNGEPDPCSRQDVTPKEDAMEDAAALSPTSLALLHAVDNLGGRKKPLDMHIKYDVDAMITHALPLKSKNHI